MKCNRKKLLSLALVLALMLGFAPGKGMTARAAVTFKDIAFDKEWTSNNTLPLGNGNYYLTTDVTLSAQQTISSSHQTIRVYLNGHSIVSEYSDVLVSSNKYTRYEFYGNGAERISGNGNNAFVYLSGSEGDAVAANGVTFYHFGRVATLNGGAPGFELIDSKIKDCNIGIDAANGSTIRINESEITGSTTVGVRQSYASPNRPYRVENIFEIKGNCEIDKVTLNSGAKITFAEGGCLTGGTAVDMSPAPTAAAPIVFTSNGGSSTFTSGSAEYTVRKNENNEWEATLPPVASVTTSGGTTTEYTTFSGALTAWTDGSTLTLLSDVEASSTISVSSGTKTLDLNGYGIKATGTGYSVITVGSGANLTLNDSRPDATHKYTIANPKSNGAGLAVVDDSSGSQTFYGGYITGSVSNSGGVSVNGGTFIMNGGSLIGNHTSEFGGGVSIIGGSFTLAGGAVFGNTAKGGGGLSLRGSATGTISGGKIQCNYSTHNGGGIHTDGANQLIVSGGSIQNNYTDGNGSVAQGGGVLLYKTAFSLSGSPDISGNKGKQNIPENVYLANKEIACLIHISDTLSNTTPIGVTMQTPGVFTGSTDTSFNDASKFVSDNASYAVGKNADGQLFLAAPVTVTFDTNGRGTAPDSLTVPGGSVITSPAAPTETGYTFGGWYTEAECLNAFDFTAAVTADTTLYAKWTLNTYTVIFDANGGTGIMAEQTASYNVAAELTANAFTRADDTFAGWNTSADGTGTPYADGASITLTGDLTLYAQWTDKALYTVSGTVTQGSATVSGVTVQLVRGEKKIAVTATDAEGKYSFSAPKDTYNIVAEHNGTTKTELVALNDNQEVIISMPSEGVNSELTVIGSEITNVMVGGLDELAEAVSNGAPVTVTMTVEEKAAADVGDTEKNAIIAEAGENQTLDYLDIAIRNGATPITDTDRDYNKVLEIVVPYRFTGKENVAVYRYHDSATPLDQLSARPSGSYDDGKYYIDRANSLIYIYASKFSTYAIGYTQCYNISGTIKYGTTYTDSVRVSLLEGETEKYTATVSLSGGSGTYSFTHVLAGTYTLRTVWTEGGKETTLNETLLVQ